MKIQTWGKIIQRYNIKINLTDSSKDLTIFGMTNSFSWDPHSLRNFKKYVRFPPHQALKCPNYSNNIILFDRTVTESVVHYFKQYKSGSTEFSKHCCLLPGWWIRLCIHRELHLLVGNIIARTFSHWCEDWMLCCAHRKFRISCTRDAIQFCLIGFIIVSESSCLNSSMLANFP